MVWTYFLPFVYYSGWNIVWKLKFDFQTEKVLHLNGSGIWIPILLKWSSLPMVELSVTRVHFYFVVIITETETWKHTHSSGNLVRHLAFKNESYNSSARYPTFLSRLLLSASFSLDKNDHAKSQNKLLCCSHTPLEFLFFLITIENKQKQHPYHQHFREEGRSITPDKVHWP